MGTHYLIGYDTNHVGDASHLNTNAALNAINNTLTANSLSAACAPAGSAGAELADRGQLLPSGGARRQYRGFRRQRPVSGGQFLGGAPASLFGLTPDTGAAFAGINPLVGRNTMFFPAGRSLYSGLQVSVRTHVTNPVRGVIGGLCSWPTPTPASAATWREGSVTRTCCPWRRISTTRPHTSAPHRKTASTVFPGSVLDLPRGSTWPGPNVQQLASPLPQTHLLPASGGVGGEIYRTDVGGDGSFGGQSQTGSDAFGDILPGTNVGAFRRAVSASELNTVIQNYNANFGDRLTPAGQALVNAGLLSRTQLLQLGADSPDRRAAPADDVSLEWLRTVDLTLARPFKFGDRFVLEPSVSAFNVFNFANFDGPADRLRAER